MFKRIYNVKQLNISILYNVKYSTEIEKKIFPFTEAFLFPKKML